MVYLLDHQLPPAYFIDQLRTITVDMAVLRDLLSFMFPVLSTHMEELRYVTIAAIICSLMFLLDLKIHPVYVDLIQLIVFLMYMMLPHMSHH